MRCSGANRLTGCLLSRRARLGEQGEGRGNFPRHFLEAERLDGRHPHRDAAESEVRTDSSQETV